MCDHKEYQNSKSVMFFYAHAVLFLTSFELSIFTKENEKDTVEPSFDKI